MAAVTGDDGEASGSFPRPRPQVFVPGSAIRGKKKKKGSSCGFETLGLSLEVYRGVKRKGYQVPTPIQRKTLPLVLAGHDVVAMARTGSGKTAAFLIPLLERLRLRPSSAGSSSRAPGPRAIILSPTRELALQTEKFLRELGRYTAVRAATLVGGDSMEAQFEALSHHPDVIIATPGRLMHHLSEVEDLSLRGVEYVVFDEADRLFEMGFASQLREILRRIPEERQTLLFSATMPQLLAEFARAGLREHHLVRLDTDTKVSPDLRMHFFAVRAGDKLPCLLHLLRDVVGPQQQTIIFVATKHHVELLQEVLTSEGHAVSVVYGAMDQTARTIHMGKFRAGKTSLLVVTDVAARGLDVPLLDNVVNFDFPPKPKLFVHRTGRVARAGRPGTAYSLLTHEELPYLLDLHLFFSRPVQAAPLEDEVVASGGKALEAAQAAADRGETVYGGFPQPLIDQHTERLRQLMGSSYSAQALAKVCEKALRLYLKTRPAPSSESVRRAKGLPRGGVHLSLRAAVDGVEAATAAFAEHLKAFRPRQTVLEAEADACKGSKKAHSQEVMRLKRGLHQPLIAQKRRRERESEHAPAGAAPRALSSETAEGNPPPSAAAAAEGSAAAHGGLVGELFRDPRAELPLHSRSATMGRALHDDSNSVGDGEPQGRGIQQPRHVSSTECPGAGAEGQPQPQPPKGPKRAKKLKQKQKPCSFRDEEFYIPDVAPNRHAEMAMSVHGQSRRSRESFQASGARELEQEILDLVPEDGEGVKQKRATYHWDKKSKKYIKLHAGEALSASGKVRTESGARVNVNSRGIYKKWRDKTHRSVGRREAEEEGGDSAQGPGHKVGYTRGDRKRGRSEVASSSGPPSKRGRHGKGGGPAASARGARNELKGEDEIRKLRQKKLHRQQRQGTPKGGAGKHHDHRGPARAGGTGGFSKQAGKSKGSKGQQNWTESKKARGGFKKRN